MGTPLWEPRKAIVEMTLFHIESKFIRTLRFLRASTNPIIFEMLALRGFTKQDRDRGWLLLNEAGGAHLDNNRTDYPPVVDKQLLKELDKWEDTLMNIAQGVLQFDYPEVLKRLLDGIQRTSGEELIITMAKFVSRYKEIQTDSDPKVIEAMNEMNRCGLNDDAILAVEGLLERLRTVGSTVEIEPEPNLNEQVEKMWGWFRKWSLIARTLPFSKRERNRMGLSKRGTSKITPEPATQEDPTQEDPTTEKEDL